MMPCRSSFANAGLCFFFYANKGTPREPVHIHVSKDDHEAKFWIRPSIKLAYNDGYDARILRDLAELLVWRAT